MARSPELQQMVSTMDAIEKAMAGLDDLPPAEAANVRAWAAAKFAPASLPGHGAARTPASPNRSENPA